MWWKRRWSFRPRRRPRRYEAMSPGEGRCWLLPPKPGLRFQMARPFPLRKPSCHYRTRVASESVFQSHTPASLRRCAVLTATQTRTDIWRFGSWSVSQESNMRGSRGPCCPGSPQLSGPELGSQGPEGGPYVSPGPITAKAAISHCCWGGGGGWPSFQPTGERPSTGRHLLSWGQLPTMRPTLTAHLSTYSL